MHKLKLAQLLGEEQKPKNKNPFAVLQDDSSSSSEEEDDTHLETEQAKQIYKKMTKKERKTHKEKIKQFENIHNPDYIFPNPTWSETLADPITTYDETRLHKYSSSRWKLTKDMLDIDVLRSNIIKEENEKSYLIEMNCMKLKEMVEPYVDENGNHPPFDMIPASLTSNPNALHNDILIQYRELTYIRKKYMDLTRQYESARGLWELLNDIISVSIETKFYKENEEIAKQLNSNALHLQLTKRKKYLENQILSVETNRILLDSGNIDSVKQENNGDKAKEMFDLKFNSLLNRPSVPVQIQMQPQQMQIKKEKVLSL